MKYKVNFIFQIELSVNKLLGLASEKVEFTVIFLPMIMVIFRMGFVSEIYNEFKSLDIMKKRMPISSIMTKDVITLNHTDDLATAERLFKSEKIRHIPVVSGSAIIGILSYTDLLRISFADSIDKDGDSIDTSVYNMFTIEQVMAKKPVSVQSSTIIKEVAEILAKKEFHALPVVDDGVLVGIVTTTDLINYLIEQF